MKSIIFGMRRRWALILGGWCLLATAALIGANSVAAQKSTPAGSLLERGRYLVKIAGCNDCHTAGYLMSEGKVPQDQWLLGDKFGWKGPWGTTYGTNLRLYMSAMSEDGWVQVARTLKARPPMPWFTLNEMEETDLRAIYQFVRSLGPVGEPAPAYLPPGEEPKTPHAIFPAPPQ
jgi:mono/diheme cytochrome c family protein